MVVLIVFNYLTLCACKCTPLLPRLCAEREVVLYCDLHGHSRKHNVFIYGCDDVADPASRLRSRVFPRMLSKNAPDKFSYKSSRFVVQKSKVSCMCVYMYTCTVCA